MKSLGDALQFLLVLGFNMRPQYVLRLIAVEAPFALGVVRRLDLVDVDIVFDLAGQQTPVLESDLLRRALEVDVGPAALVELVGAMKTSVLRGSP